MATSAVKCASERGGCFYVAGGRRGAPELGGTWAPLVFRLSRLLALSPSGQKYLPTPCTRSLSVCRLLTGKQCIVEM